MSYEQVQKVTEDGKPVFLLPQPDLEVPYQNVIKVKTTTETETPVMRDVKLPMLDENDVQRSYELTQPEEQEDGSIVQVGTGQFLLLWTMGTEQEKDTDDAPLFWTDEVQDLIRYEQQEPIEITEDDERYVEGLEPAYELIELPPEPVQERVLSPVEQQLADLRESHKALKQQVNVNDEKINTTSTDLGGFMDFYFEN